LYAGFGILEWILVEPLADGTAHNLNIGFLTVIAASMPPAVAPDTRETHCGVTSWDALA
jgi:hypothetical protein